MQAYADLSSDEEETQSDGGQAAIRHSGRNATFGYGQDSSTTPLREPLRYGQAARDGQAQGARTSYGTNPSAEYTSQAQFLPAAVRHQPDRRSSSGIQPQPVAYPYAQVVNPLDLLDPRRPQFQPQYLQSLAERGIGGQMQATESRGAAAVQVSRATDPRRSSLTHSRYLRGAPPFVPRFSRLPNSEDEDEDEDEEDYRSHDGSDEGDRNGDGDYDKQRKNKPVSHNWAQVQTAAADGCQPPNPPPPGPTVTFRYIPLKPPLGPGQFRLIRLLPCDKQDEIHCVMKTYDSFSPNHCPEYLALSWVWGDDPMSCRVVITNKQKVMRCMSFKRLE